ncbi:MAG: phosphotransferase family protein [Telmatospirillum sp.]|nr:phosphotransferase family protein [Telmatospirillum sp.]
MALNAHAAPPGLAGWLVGALGATQVQVLAWRQLSGGAIQENWAFQARLRGGPNAGTLEAVLRTDAPTGVAASHGRIAEYTILDAANKAGVKVPEPLAVCADPSVIGKPFYVMRRLEGTALGHILVNDAKWTGDRAALVASLGGELAKLHKIRPPQAALGFLGEAPASPALAAVEAYRTWLDGYRVARPALELALRWLERNAPETDAVVLCHRDFRTGNFMADETGLAGILDWEFAGWGDRHEDIGWFCAKCWRFGQIAREAGGVGARADFLRGYATAGGAAVDPAKLRYWEIMAHARWATIALQQNERFVAGGEASLDLALTGRRIAELEYELLAAIDADAQAGGLPPGLPRDRADASELASLARDVLAGELLSQMAEGARLKGLMLANALGIVARTLAAEPCNDGDGNRALAAAIRSGKHDADRGLHGALRDDAKARTLLFNPKYPF